MLRFFKIPPDENNPGFTGNRLHQYIQSRSVQDMAKMASEINPDVKQMIGMNVQALLGYLPGSDFTTTISASKENMQSLLASAMLTGYFLHAMENRMLMEDVFKQEENDSIQSSLEEVEQLLKSPAELFPFAEETSETETLQAEKKGRFLNGDELREEIENAEEADIQIEINAASMDLPALLEELQSLPFTQNASSLPEEPLSEPENTDS
ncbi:hypothetical protein COW36_02725 [bacterium (Candidatus Blackallbacteria) CG17_big_fil_post_rev_8_21_14_2_50_48_46]|uniref:DUF760 domain-containing protein n=1 Tax=bacterium (Candidatus Blackallbacteria) CG17_big_fil_post_rev_8_21_14_2_50_48_46 TaxID=2014261 RepID=A0A2M7GA65_9BACT|nr:MAG: hypothetical protein COW64_12750 [bacterium (Candidatus Blackallbacteria) CG18_big_fil_WC_8_21_14_2_50_49_26]PIW19043.1 MAG: hypothetical protein COW36_02725 [bacterium (Candidatus Blackallbacteria) CG17_big_fil_post_rev_8_21_14_2_50_48_46]PIW44590.1 MAG: hypothetical protein COW20_23395 [bacterium (Candidatus Blackallbacteria) CG13_big_fil_rev_8_21_14_2_50_49_14]